MSLLNSFNLARNMEFRGRVQVATFKAASNILADPAQPQHSHQWSQLVFNQPNGDWLQTMVNAVVSNPAITDQSTDSDIEFTVNSQLEKLAKAFFGVQE